MKNCWDRFDRKTIIYFTGYKDTRVPAMEKELHRVGINDVERQWQFPTPLNKTILRAVKHDPTVERAGWFSASMAHYRAIATAYHLGCESVLIMEDDIRFRKDLSGIPGVVNAIPEDFDVALFECTYRCMRPWCDEQRYVEWRDGRVVNEHWAEFDRMFSLACYALSRRGMERMMFCYEAVETAPQIGKIRICDHFLDRNILGKDSKLYFNRRNLCIQRRMGAASSDMDLMTARYPKMGIDINDYAE